MSENNNTCDLCGKSLVSYYEKTNSETVSVEGKELFLCPNCKVNYKDNENKIVAKVKENEKEEIKASESKRILDNFILTTTNQIEYKKITNYIGIVSAEVVEGVGIFKDAFAGVRNTFGGRSKAMKKVMKEMREEAIDELKKEAIELGANGIVGLSLDFDEYAEKMMMLTVSGTAVEFE